MARILRRRFIDKALRHGVDLNTKQLFSGGIVGAVNP